MDERKNNGFDFSVLLHNFFQTLRFMFWLPLVLALVLGAFRYIQLRRSYVPVYESSSVYVVTTDYRGGVDASTYGFQLDPSAAKTLATSYPYIMSSERTKHLLLQRTGSSSLPATVTCQADANLLSFRATGTDPKAVYQALLLIEEIFPEAAADNRIGLKSLPNDYIEEPTAPVNPFRPVRAVLKFVLLGAALGLALTLGLAMLRKTVHNSEELRELLSSPFLGFLPAVRFKARTKGNQAVLLTNHQLEESYAESIRGIRYQLGKELQNTPSKVIMVTSTSPGEGKSTVSANLALSLADQGARVVLVDCDLRKQTLRRLFGLSGSSKGLTELLSGKGENVLDALKSVEGSSLMLLSGSKTADNPQSLLGSSRLQSVIGTLRKKFDYVIVDTPPCGILSDAAALSDWVDGTIYVVRQDYVNRSAILDSASALSAMGVRFIGCVLNFTNRATSRSGYGYSYGYGTYGYGGYGYGYGYGKKYYGKSGGDSADAESDSTRKQ